MDASDLDATRAELPDALFIWTGRRLGFEAPLHDPAAPGKPLAAATARAIRAAQDSFGA